MYNFIRFGNHIVNKNFIKHAELVTIVPKKISILLRVEKKYEKRALILKQHYYESKFRNYVSIAYEDFKDLEKRLNK